MHCDENCCNPCQNNNKKHKTLKIQDCTLQSHSNNWSLMMKKKRKKMYLFVYIYIYNLIQFIFHTKKKKKGGKTNKPKNRNILFPLFANLEYHCYPHCKTESQPLCSTQGIPSPAKKSSLPGIYSNKSKSQTSTARCITWLSRETSIHTWNSVPVPFFGACFIWKCQAIPGVSSISPLASRRHSVVYVCTSR